MSFAVNDGMDAMRHDEYQIFAVLLGDFSDPNFLHRLLWFSALGGCLYTTLYFTTVHKFLIGLSHGLFPDHSSIEMGFFSDTLIGGKEHRVA